MADFLEHFILKNNFQYKILIYFHYFIAMKVYLCKEGHAALIYLHISIYTQRCAERRALGSVILHDIMIIPIMLPFVSALGPYNIHALIIVQYSTPAQGIRENMPP